MFQIHNRRYLGSKFKLLAFIDDVIRAHCRDCRTLTDLFGGTGVVAHHFNNRFRIRINDILFGNFLAYRTFFSDEAVSWPYLKDLIEYYNQLNDMPSENYYSRHFADTFLGRRNMLKVGVIRDDIDTLSAQGKINAREQAVLITSLLYAIDRIANTVGHYDAFRRNGDLIKPLLLQLPETQENHNQGNQIFQQDANELVKNIQSDIVYIDPPYNSRQYGDAYHFLENVAVNAKPQVHGVARKMDRSRLKSNYCTQKAAAQFGQLIDDTDAKYILVSYNNTGSKINSRSNAKISDVQIMEILQKKGKVSVFEQDFHAFTTGKTQLSKHKERLFLCEVGIRDETFVRIPDNARNEGIVKSPLNYTGGKGKLLPQIKAKLPEPFGVFYDVFSGGANTGANVLAEQVICIDKNRPLIDLLNYIQSQTYVGLVAALEQKIAHYGLSDTFRHDYDFYKCSSSKGLGEFNKAPFARLRQDYNQYKDNLLFLIIIFYGFNNQIRFNQKGEFNLPVGKRDFNASLRKKLRLFMERLHTRRIRFACQDFRDLDIKHLQKQQAFLYLDPPYLLGTAAYNEHGGWTARDEQDLLHFLKVCDEHHIRFALSNVMKHKGEMHQQLLDWSVAHSFNINYLNFRYPNANYQAKHKSGETQEVLITNYRTPSENNLSDGILPD
ncbi:Dam family site-specific DNA-(adenine-N6)-methyltransferase [Neisseria iguanae]|nr:Dam family site-specific DNA-(adenine-N6)-methyltransferase [Neisseria iguanae]